MRLFAAFMAMVVWGAAAWGQQAAPAKSHSASQPSTKRIQIPDGEKLSYSASWRLWKAGSATLQLTRQGQQEHVVFDANSVGVTSLLYPVHDHIDSAYTPDTFCATTLTKQTVEGRRHLHTQIRYRPNNKELILDEQNFSGKKPTYKHEVKPIPGCVLDIFSALYYVRSLPLVVGEIYNFPVNEGGATVEVQLKPDLKETIATPAGTFHTIRTEPFVFNSVVFHHKGRMWVWFSDDKRHLPVMVEAKVSWGTITAVLTHYEWPGMQGSESRPSRLSSSPRSQARIR